MTWAAEGWKYLEQAVNWPVISGGYRDRNRGLQERMGHISPAS